MFEIIVVAVGNGKYRYTFQNDFLNSGLRFWPGFAQSLDNILATLNTLLDHSLLWI